MRIHCLRHVPFEDEANIGLWARENGHQLDSTSLYLGQGLPRPEDLDLLVVMGGPMNIYEHDLHPWLIREKRCISEVIAAGRGVLGVCLGAQLAADVLGGPVSRNAHKEIGWLTVSRTPESDVDPAFAALPRAFPAYHWHGDTFALPPGAMRLASSEACLNQAFCWGKRVWGLQFHLETSAASMQRLMDNCADEIAPGPYIQTAEEMGQRAAENLPLIEALMRTMLDAVAAALAARGK